MIEVIHTITVVAKLHKSGRERKYFYMERKEECCVYVGGLELKAANIYVQIHSYTLMMIHFLVHLKKPSK